MHWRELIHRFLTACAEDEREGCLAAEAKRRSRFIREWGAADLRRGEAERIKSNLEKCEAPLGSPDEYRVIDESPLRIVVEVDRGPNGQPYRLTRFRLAPRDSGFELVDFYWKCGVCKDGHCTWCKGTGVCHMCEGEGKCDFCEDAVCLMCEGVRVCNICQDGDMPGWKRMSY